MNVFISKMKNASVESGEAPELLARPGLVRLNIFSGKSPCHLPLPAISSVTNITALVMLLESSNFRLTVFSESEEHDLGLLFLWHVQ